MKLLNLFASIYSLVMAVPMVISGREGEEILQIEAFSFLARSRIFWRHMTSGLRLASGHTSEKLGASKRVQKNSQRQNRRLWVYKPSALDISFSSIGAKYLNNGYLMEL
jgi:hypothetical protein